MPKQLSHIISEAERSRITDAVRSAEGKTAGEIVPCIVEKSDDYEEAIWLVGLFSALIVLIPYLILHTMSESWLPWSAGETILSSLVLSSLTMMGMWFFPGLRIVVTPRERTERRVAQKAKEVFLAEEVFKTRDRTGILIFVSLLERSVVVLGDSGINAKVEQSAWEGITGHVTNGMKSGQPAEGLIRAIHASGELLQRHGIARRADDRDELSDGLRKEA